MPAIIRPKMSRLAKRRESPFNCGMAKCVTFPRLKVYALPSGEIIANHREGALPPIDDGWWQSLLHDPRARIPTETTRFDPDSPFSYLRLDRQNGREILFDCACGKSGVMDKAKLIEQMGGDYNVAWLARHIFDCKSRNKVSNHCHARCLR
jgi:hypothetical protein